jgi:UDP-glucose:(heptosyl)LPS alpha-1,3-glucosyltransferase
VKLAFFLFKYFPYGGLERNFLRIALLARSRSHDVTVYTQEWQGEIPPELKVNVLPFSARSSHGRADEFALAARNLLEKERFDVVVGFNKMPGLDLYYAADPCLQHSLRQRFGGFYKLIPRYRTFVALEEAVFSPQSGTEIMLLAASAQDIFTRYYHTPAHRFHVLPPGISRDRVAPPNAGEIRAELRREFAIEPTQKLLLHVGSAFRRKGLDRALFAMASLPENAMTRMIVVGEDKPRPFLDLARRLKLESRVHIVGARDDVTRFLLGADLLLHPARSENTGTVILEAIVSGLPVLATEVCGWADHIIQADAGRVVAEPFQQTELNRALNEMLTSSEYPKWRENALAYARNNDLYTRPEKIIELIEARANSSAMRGREHAVPK